MRSFGRVPTVLSKMAVVEIQTKRMLTVVPSLELPLTPNRTNQLNRTPMRLTTTVLRMNSVLEVDVSEG